MSREKSKPGRSRILGADNATLCRPCKGATNVLNSSKRMPRFGRVVCGGVQLPRDCIQAPSGDSINWLAKNGFGTNGTVNFRGIFLDVPRKDRLDGRVTSNSSSTS